MGYSNLSLVVFNSDMNRYVLIRNKVGSHFGPLNQTKIPTKEIVFVTDIIQLFLALYSVQIEVINGSNFALVFVYKREGWTAYFIGNAQMQAEFLDQRGFSSAHFSREKNDLFCFRELPQVMANTVEFRNACCLEFLGQNDGFRPLR